VVSQQGERFLIKVPIVRAESQAITVTMNWSAVR
jgi:hypothetical protein